jgi:hypothetical protein
MAALSISRAWDETKARIALDGRLMAIVAAALIALPGIVYGVISPASQSEGTVVTAIALLVSSLLALIGQLAIIRLAIGPAVSVGEAIAHGARRMPIYVVAGVILTVGLFLALIPLVVIMAAAGVPLDKGNEQAIAQSPVALLLMIVWLLLALFILVRMLMSSPVASEEAAGPIQILRRSWEVTSGHWLRLLGFILLFIIGAMVAIRAVNWTISFVAVALFGPVEPMSVSALLVSVANSFVNAVATVLLAVMLARIYVQLVGRGSIDVTVPRSGT